ncbi:MAG: glycosyltransferase [Saprospiraceae bacterium]|nr:glycosyltransferase [Saprospiraceae bacterium]
MSADTLEPKRILHVIDGFGGGGAETWLLASAKYLKANSCLNMHFDFLATGGQPRVFDEEIKELGCKIFYVKYSYRNFFRFRKQLKAILKENKYNAIHDHQDFVSGWHFLLGLGYLPHIKITHLHNPYNFVNNYIVSAMRWLSFKAGRLLTVMLTTKITGTSNHVMDEYGYKKWPYKNKRVPPAYCGFEVNEFRFSPEAKTSLCKELEWDENVKIALFVGRIDLHENENGKNQKNPEFAFQVANELVLNNKGWKFLFVGFKGQLANKMEEETLQLGIKDKIRFLGFRKDIPGIMSSADMLIFPSFWEGLGMIVVEAQASGLKVLAADTIPQEAILTDLVLSKSLSENVASWVEAILQFNSNAFNRNAYQKQIEASGFSIINSVNRLKELYELAE